MEEQQPITRDKLGVRVVCVSDTHGRHADIKVPDGDILIHAGDFTHFGKKKDVIAVNEWLGTLPHKHKIVVNGNHEKNAEWKKDTAKLLSNCSFFLKDSMVTVKVDILQTEAKDDLSSINLLKEGQHSSDKEGSDKNNLGENTTSASTNKMKTKVVYVGIYGSIDRIGTNREGGRENVHVNHHDDHDDDDDDDDQLKFECTLTINI
mmetsp:Transcript_23158/g.38971  ORF Transcript_23158/g.38971 Transcript_23158/m.38971 type:complete len:206 (-) Transcript_23158:98-715(-)